MEKAFLVPRNGVLGLLLPGSQEGLPYSVGKANRRISTRTNDIMYHSIVSPRELFTLMHDERPFPSLMRIHTQTRRLPQLCSQNGEFVRIAEQYSHLEQKVTNERVIF